jgi:tetratricopeptide (TPR) repeat protein
MPTTQPTKKSAEANAAAAARLESYDQAVAAFAAALDLLHRGEHAQARERFLAIAATAADEPALIERSHSFARVCDRRLAGPPAEPQSADDRYHRAVTLANAGELEAAIAMFDRVLEDEPSSVRALYARASTWALKRNADAAVADLRRAIQAEPRVRFQAVNDPDFEPIREEPAFIDLIEPSPAGP